MVAQAQTTGVALIGQSLQWGILFCQCWGTLIANEPSDKQMRDARAIPNGGHERCAFGCGTRTFRVTYFLGTPMSLSHLPKLVQALPLDDAVRIEPCEGVPVFRATPRVQGRIENLLEKQTEGPLDASEERELLAYEELDELLSLVNRLVRNSMSPDGSGETFARTA